MKVIYEYSEKWENYLYSLIIKMFEEMRNNCQNYFATATYFVLQASGQQQQWETWHQLSAEAY